MTTRRFTARRLSLPALTLVAVAIVTVPAAPASAQSDGPALFVVNNVSDEISSVAIEPDGSLTFIANKPSNDGPMAIALSPDGRRLAVTHGTVNDDSEFVEIFAVNADATLDLLFTGSVPDSPLAAVWLNNDTVAITETSFGNANFARVYRVQATPPALIEIDAEPTGGFSSSLAVHPDLSRLYAQDSNAPYTIFEFQVAADGQLTSAGATSTGAVYPLDLVLTRDGDYLYAGGGISSGGDKVLGYGTASTRALTAIPGAPFVSPGASPAYLAVARDDSFLFVGHGTDATVHAFAIAPSGALSTTGFSFDVGLQGTIGDIQSLDDLLFITDESTAIDGIAGVYTFRVKPDGSFAVIGSILDTGGVRPESMAVWSGRTRADTNGDGVVNTDDFLAVLAGWGPCPMPCPPHCAADVTLDCQVNTDDFLAILDAWFP